MKWGKQTRKLVAVISCFSILAVSLNRLSAASGPGNRPLTSLKTVPVAGPTAPELNDLVIDKAKAIALGKAFFWEMQFGSYSATACPSCHFAACADTRSGNQTDPC